MESIDKSIVDFLKKLNEDQALADRISKSANPEEAYEIAKENGVTVSCDEFKDTMTVLAAAAKGELSEEEMQAVAGGLSVGGLAIGLGIATGGAALGTIGIVGTLLTAMAAG